MRRFPPVLRRLPLAAAAAWLVACSGAGPGGAPAPAALQTRAERTRYLETSSHADVLAFLDALASLGLPMRAGRAGVTGEGRAIPYVVASRPLFATPDDARRSGRPVVYVQGNIHAGEVEGKEALQALLRDLLLEPRPNVLDSIVLVAVPIYNGDGNERLDRQARNRGAQNGPEMVGQRPNAQGLDLNRDYIKADAPETRASLAMFNAWDPHVFVDLHTTNGSYHGYNLTHSPSLNPAAALPGTRGGAYARDTLLPAIQERTRQRHGVASFPYGNFSQDEGAGAQAPRAWVTYDHRPRFGTNYYALRGRISILSEAYSHDPFARRVEATHAFVRELLSVVAERGGAVRELARQSDSLLVAGGSGAPAIAVPVRARLTTSPRMGDVVAEVLQRSTDTARTEPGVRPGTRRTGQYVTTRMAIHDRFEPALVRPAAAAWAIDARDTSALNLLALHGVKVRRLTAPWTGDPGPQFTADSAIVSPRPFQGHREVRLEGRWASAGPVNLAEGTVIVPVAQPLGVLVTYLLEPESDDGIVTWDVGNRSGVPRRTVTRLSALPDVAMTPPR